MPKQFGGVNNYIKEGRRVLTASIKVEDHYELLQWVEERIEALAPPVGGGASEVILRALYLASKHAGKDFAMPASLQPNRLFVKMEELDDKIDDLRRLILSGNFARNDEPEMQPGLIDADLIDLMGEVLRFGD